MLFFQLLISFCRGIFDPLLHLRERIFSLVFRPVILIISPDRHKEDDRLGPLNSDPIIRSALHCARAFVEHAHLRSQLHIIALKVCSYSERISSVYAFLYIHLCLCPAPDLFCHEGLQISREVQLARLTCRQPHSDHIVRIVCQILSCVCDAVNRIRHASDSIFQIQISPVIFRGLVRLTVKRQVQVSEGLIRAPLFDAFSVQKPCVHDLIHSFLVILECRFPKFRDQLIPPSLIPACIVRPGIRPALPDCLLAELDLFIRQLPVKRRAHVSVPDHKRLQIIRACARSGNPVVIRCRFIIPKR